MGLVDLDFLVDLANPNSNPNLVNLGGLARGDFGCPSTLPAWTALRKVSFVGKPAAVWYQNNVWRVLGRSNSALRLSVGCCVSSGSFHSPMSLHRGAVSTGGLVVLTSVVVAS